MVAVKTGFTPPPVPGMPAPMQPMMPMGGAPARNPFAPMPPMPLAGMPPPPAQPPMAQQSMPQMQQQGSNAPRRRRFGDSLEGMLSRNQGLGSMAAQRRPLPMPPQMMPQPRMVAPGTPMMRTPTPRPMAMGGEVDIFGYDDGGLVIRTLSDGNAYIDFGGGAYHHVSPSALNQDVVGALQGAYGDRISGVTAATAEQEADILAKLAAQRGSSTTDDGTSTTDNTTSTTNNTTTTNNNNTATTNNNTATTTVGDTSQNTAVMTGDIGYSGTGANTASLFGPNINIPEKTSQFVQNPVTGQITTTAGPTMTAVSPIGAINLPAAPVEIDIFDYLGDPTYGSLLDKQVEGMAQGGSVQGFDMGGHAHPHNNNSSIGSSGYVSLDAIANQAVQADDDVSFKHMGKSYDNVSDYHKAIFGDDDDDDDDDVQDFNNPNAGDGGGSTTSIGSGSAGSLGSGGGGSGGGSSSAPPTPVVYRDMYGRTYGSQAEADAANRMIMQAQDDKPDRTIDKAIAGPDLAYDDALALTQGVLPPQFSGAVPPGSQFSYGNIGGIYANDSDAAFGFNLPPAVVEPEVIGQELGPLQNLDIIDPDSTPNIINLNAPVSGTTYPNAPPPGTGTTTTSTTSGIQPASNTNVPDNTASTGYFPEDPGTGFPSSGTTAQNLNQGLGGADNQNTGNQNTGNQSTGGTTTGGGDPGYRPPPNAAETAYLQNLLGQFEFDDKGKMVFAEPGVVEKVINQIVSNLSLGLIDLEDLDNQKVQAVLDAYKETGRFAYDSEGNAINLETIADLEKLERLSSGRGIEPAVIGVYDSEGNIISYGPDIKNTKDGPVVVSNVDIFGSDNGGGGSNTSTTNGGGGGGGNTGHVNGVCNNPDYVYNPETDKCEPKKVEEDDLGSPITTAITPRSFDEVLANVVIPAPDIAPISANIRPMKMGGMAGLNRAADNFIKALAG